MSMFNEWQLNGEEYMPIINQWTPLPVDVATTQINTVAPAVTAPVTLPPGAADVVGAQPQVITGRERGNVQIRPVKWKPRLPQSGMPTTAPATTTLPPAQPAAPAKTEGWTIGGVTITPLMLALYAGGAIVLLYFFSNMKGKK